MYGSISVVGSASKPSVHELAFCILGSGTFFHKFSVTGKRMSC